MIFQFLLLWSRKSVSSTQMGLPGLSSSILRCVLNIFIYATIICCLRYFPTSITANSRLGGNYTDQQALLAFKAQISDPLQVLNSWNGTTHFCQWRGVTCGHRHQRVSRLSLNSFKLGGSISPHIGNLSFLRLLDLGNNDLRDSSRNWTFKKATNLKFTQ